jgi:hypothetical protein
MQRHLAAFLLLVSTFPLAAQPVPPDSPSAVAGVDVACTGASLDAREDPRWSGYSLKLEFAGEGGRYLGGETVTLKKDGKTVFRGSCDSPWLLLRLPAGRYAVEAGLDGQTVTASALVPATGQARVILRFSDSGQIVSQLRSPS